MSKIKCIGCNPEWRDKGLCREVDNPEIFSDTSNPEYVAAAKKVCAGCTVREDCLDEGLWYGGSNEIWGGMTETERNEVDEGTRDRNDIGVPVTIG